MNKTWAEAQLLIEGVVGGQISEGRTLILATPFTYLQSAVKMTASRSDIQVAAQNCHQFSGGA